MNHSREFPEIDSICSGKISHVPSQPAVVPSLRSVLSRDRSIHHLIHGICLGFRETFLAIHVTCSIHHRYLIIEFFTHRINVPRVYTSAEKYRETCRERWITNWKHNSNSNVCRKAVNQRKFHRILWLYSKDCKYRSFSLINSSHLQRFHVGWWDSKPR